MTSVTSEAAYETGVTIFVWETRNFSVIGHACLQMYRQGLKTELVEKNFARSVRIVERGAQGKRRLARALNGSEEAIQARNLEAENRLYVSFWPGADMPACYEDDMVRETGDKAVFGLNDKLRKQRQIANLRDNMANKRHLRGNLTEREIEIGMPAMLDSQIRQDEQAIASIEAEIDRISVEGMADQGEKKKETWHYMEPRPNQRRLDRRNTGAIGPSADLIEHGTEARWIDTLPCLSTGVATTQKPYFGLSLSRMARWWETYLNDNMVQKMKDGVMVEETNHSTYTGRNCASACVGALKAGGAEAYAPCPINQYVLVTAPNDVHKWVATLGLKLDRLQSMASYLDFVLRQFDDILLDPLEDLMTVDEFKRQTYIASSRARIIVRTGPIAAIDTQLGRYHRLYWGESFGDKLGCLAAIVPEAYAYFCKNRDSHTEAKRGAGLARLVKQTFQMLRRESLT